MPNVVFVESLRSDIPLEHGLQARKYFIKHNVVVVVTAYGVHGVSEPQVLHAAWRGHSGVHCGTEEAGHDGRREQEHRGMHTGAGSGRKQRPRHSAQAYQEAPSRN